MLICGVFHNFLPIMLAIPYNLILALGKVRPVLTTVMLHIFKKFYHKHLLLVLITLSGNSNGVILKGSSFLSNHVYHLRHNH